MEKCYFFFILLPSSNGSILALAGTVGAILTFDKGFRYRIGNRGKFCISGKLMPPPTISPQAEHRFSDCNCLSPTTN
jgi:hypothetical protein